ncbi:unnamed protein product [Darwinula stevensoni]|uniref:H15 domain-containing protein n=1 Tax=Darwinula stevensoni TaxID=69355 RepID=A0A7R9A2I3_9CRUS|nr:unnamed protein product [Darwinula stevensoni]CAG0885719.1 unnamed protein product [Darwinula stevensoni]
MADAAVAPAASPAKKGGKAKGGAAKPKKAVVHNHPPYGDMIVAAIAALKERSGSSRMAILKYIMQHYNVGTDSKVVNSRVKIALKRAEGSGKIKHAKGGVGATGSFKLSEKAEKPKKAVKKPKAKKPASPKKAKVAKPKAQKSTKPKASKPKKSPKKPKSPKKAGAAKPKAAKPKAAKPKAAKAKASPKK